MSIWTNVDCGVIKTVESKLHPTTTHTLMKFDQTLKKTNHEMVALNNNLFLLLLKFSYGVFNYRHR